MKFNQLTQYIPHFTNNEYTGTWIIDNKSKGTIDDPIQGAYVSYNKIVHKFIIDTISFTEAYFNTSILDLNYLEMFKSIQPKLHSIPTFTEHELITYLIYIVRRERFCEGTLKARIDDGTIYIILTTLHNYDIN